MKQRDVLDEIRSGRISDAEADDFFDLVIDSPLSYDAKRILSLSAQEWGAKIQGAAWGSLANWRYFGWPKLCIRCGKSIDHEKFGWWIVCDGDGEKLRHIRCPE